MSERSGDQPRAHLGLVLHAHLPFVRHPEHEFFLEEDWLFEAVTETYIPLLQVFRALEQAGVHFNVTLVMSPPLISMLDDDLLRSRYSRHLDLLGRLVDAEQRRTRDHGHLSYLATHYRGQVDWVARTWQELDGDLVSEFARLQSRGYLDILTCGATHGYLPLLQVHPQAVWAQLKVAVDHYRRRFGRAPTGIWLPECGYYQGLDTMLAAAGLRYFIADTHGLLLAEPVPSAGSHAPIFTTDAGVAAFARDRASSVEVWSRERGYPGDGIYRDFYRDIGHDLPLDVIGPYLRPEGIRKSTGIKYHRITGPTDHKQLYDPYWARARAEEHADDFVNKRLRQLDDVGIDSRRAPLVVAPYDAELFGHWWYEGPWWIERVLRRVDEERRRGALDTIHLRRYLTEYSTHQLARPAQSSWGERGFHEYWLNESNQWIYPPLHRAAEKMIALASAWPAPDPLSRRALQQAARELLLAQASDWAFIMRTGTAVEYAERRTRSHLGRFAELARQLDAHAIDEDWLRALEYMDNIFGEIDYRVYGVAER